MLDPDDNKRMFRERGDIKMDIEDLYKSSIPPESKLTTELTPDEARTIYRSFLAMQDTAETQVETYEKDDIGRQLWIDRLESLKKLIDRWNREFSDCALDTVNDD